MIDEKQLDEWEESTNAASSGPWANPDWFVVDGENEHLFECEQRGDQWLSTAKRKEDAWFLCTAREAMPLLIREVRRLRKLVLRLLEVPEIDNDLYWESHDRSIVEAVENEPVVFEPGEGD